MARSLQRIGALLLAALVTACAVGPDYRAPVPAVDPAFTRADASLVSAEPVESAFWRGLGDPLLSQLVDEALAANLDLAAAMARLEQARALRRERGLDRLPTVTANAQAADVRLSASEAAGVPAGFREVEQYGAGIDALWELDLFGRVRRAVEAAGADRDAAEADLAALRVAVVADVADAYFQLRGLQEQLRVARENADNQAGSQELVALRLEAGRGTDFDLARSRALLAATRAQVPALEAAVAATAHRLAVLTGRAPTALIAELEAPAPLPALPARIAVGDPVALVRRRPDLAAAERRLAGATARIGVATADLYPRFTLSALIGSQAFDSDLLFERDSERRIVALGIDWSFLDVGRVRARIAAAEAGADAALAQFQQAVLLALEETETALARYRGAVEQARLLDEAAAASGQAARLARLRFEAGAADFLQVLDAERSQLEAEDRFAAARAEAGRAFVAVHRALAGGWEPPAAAAIADAAAGVGQAPSPD